MLTNMFVNNLIDNIIVVNILSISVNIDNYRAKRDEAWQERRSEDRV